MVKRIALVGASSTGKTTVYELLKNKLLPQFSGQRSPLKIWSAASSSGQEPYSIAMSVLEYQQSKPGAFPGGVQIVGTDISSTMLEHCKYAHYDSLALARGLSAERKRLFFENGDNGMLKVKDNVKKLVSFRPLNLLNSYSLMGRFDIVFCRNVLIYFAPEISRGALDSVYVLPPAK